MTRRMELGSWGEERACAYLVEKRYKVLDRNARKSWGELDIVAKSPDGTLVFVEVKTMCSGNSSALTPEDQMMAGKLERFRKAASFYAGSHQNLIDASRGWRLDVITIEIDALPENPPHKNFILKLLGTSKNTPRYALRHYTNV